MKELVSLYHDSCEDSSLHLYRCIPLGITSRLLCPKQKKHILILPFLKFQNLGYHHNLFAQQHHFSELERCFVHVKTGNSLPKTISYAAVINMLNCSYLRQLVHTTRNSSILDTMQENNNNTYLTYLHALLWVLSFLKFNHKPLLFLFSFC